ncbi:MAG: hypothetical protein SGILL_010261, partial [Bacillariaceae sp.]
MGVQDVNTLNLANDIVPSDEDVSNIETLHLVELHQRFGLNLFPVEEVYRVEEHDGVKRYLTPKATYKHYCYFKSVKKTGLRISLKNRFGAGIGPRIMKRYLSFEHEFNAYCWGSTYWNIQLLEDAIAEFWSST